MQQNRKLFLLVTPSWLSLIIGAMLSFVIVGLSCYLFALNGGKLGAFNIHDYLISVNIVPVGAVSQSLLTSLRLDTLSLLIFWSLIGFIVYCILFIMKGSAAETFDFFHRLNYVNAHALSQLEWFLLRSFLLVIALGLWIGFSLGFVLYILPLTLNLITNTIVDGQSAAYILIAFAVLLLTTQAAVILLRFTLLRARLTDLR